MFLYNILPALRVFLYNILPALCNAPNARCEVRVPARGLQGAVRGREKLVRGIGRKIV